MQSPQESQGPLSVEEQIELRKLLGEAGGATLEFARGVFYAAASAPSGLAPTDWLGLVLGEECSNAAILSRTFSLLMGDYNDCVERLVRAEPRVPDPEESDLVEQFCKGYVRATRKDKKWSGRPEALELTLPFAVLGGFVPAERARELVPKLVVDTDHWIELQRSSLARSVVAAFAFFADERSIKSAAKSREKTGRNEPCPCGSGDKYKKCCGAN